MCVNTLVKTADFVKQVLRRIWNGPLPLWTLTTLMPNKSLSKDTGTVTPAQHLLLRREQVMLHAAP